MLQKISKILSIALCLYLLSTGIASALPTPDWGALLRERERMVTAIDFELYTEGSLESAVYYNARLEPEAGSYIGMVAENSSNFAPLSSYLTYFQDMWQNDIYYPANKMIATDDVVATIGWTITDLDAVDYDAVRNGLDNLASYNKPMFIRFANEMNESSLGDDPDKYVSVFRNVANMVHEYENFAVVWSPCDLGALDKNFEYYWPGDEYVDWIGLSCYAIKYFQGNENTSYKDSVYFMTGVYSWPTNRVKPLFEFIKKYNINKPVMISEGGVPTGNAFGEDLEYWAAPRLRNMMWYLVMKYPQIKLINYFNKYMDNEFRTYDLDDYPYAVEIFNEAKESGAYIRSYGDSPDFVFQPADAGETLIANDNIVNLYTLAYLPEQPNISVNYTIDGNWFHSTNQAPYKCCLDISTIADGRHTMGINACGQSKSYVFYKSGNAIRFGAEPVGATVEWDEGTYTILISDYSI